jgi:hypothetical protein
MATHSGDRERTGWQDVWWKIKNIARCCGTSKADEVLDFKTYDEGW